MVNVWQLKDELGPLSVFDEDGARPVIYTDMENGGIEHEITQVWEHEGKVYIA